MKGRHAHWSWGLFLAASLPAAQMVSVDFTGTNAGGNSVSEQYHISANGRYAAFSGVSPRYVVGDSNGIGDVFVHDCVTRSNVWDTTYSRAVPIGSAAGSLPRALSPDGRFLLFESRATNHVTGFTFTNSNIHLYLRDLHQGITTLLTVSASGNEPANASLGTGASASAPTRLAPDGRFVIFSSPATNMVTLADTNEGTDVFRRDVASGTTELVTVSPNGATALDRPTLTFAASTNAQFVAFLTAATNVVPGLVNTSGLGQVYWRDLESGATSLVSSNADGQVSRGAGLAGLTGDGRFVCFSTGDTNVVSGVPDGNGTQDYYIRDMLSGEAWLVTKSTNGATTSSRSSAGQFSANGEWLVFGNSSGEVVSGITNHPRNGLNIFVHHLPTRTNQMVSVSTSGNAGASGFVSPSFSVPSATGRYVVFSCQATNLVLNSTGTVQRLFLRDVPGNYTRTVFHAIPLVTPGFDLARHQISDDERHIFFLSQRNYDPSVTKLEPGFELFRVPLFAPEITHFSTNLIRADGLAAEAYTLQLSPNLSAWTNVSSTIADEQGRVTVPLSLEPDSSPQRFYRLIWE